MHISSKGAVAVHCLIFLHEFGRENRVTSRILGLSTGCNPVVIRGIMSSLGKAGIVENRPGRGGALLIKSPEELTLFDIYQAVEPDFLDRFMGEHRSPSPACIVGRNIHGVLDRSFSKLGLGVKSEMQRITLGSVLEDYRAAAAAEDTSPALRSGDPSDPSAG